MDWQKRIVARGKLPYLLGRLGWYYAQSGNITEANKLVAELEALFDTSNISNIASSLSWIMNGLGERDKSIEWLNRFVERRDTAVVELNIIPYFDGQRDDPRFQILLKKIGLE